MRASLPPPTLAQDGLEDVLDGIGGERPAVGSPHAPQDEGFPFGVEDRPLAAIFDPADLQGKPRALVQEVQESDVEAVDPTADRG